MFEVVRIWILLACWRSLSKKWQLGDSQTGPRNLRLLTLSPILGIYTLPTSPSVGGIFKTQCWDSYVLWDHLDGMSWLNLLRSPHKLLRFWQVGSDLLVFWPPKISLISKFPCLINLKWSASFFSLLLPCIDTGEVCEAIITIAVLCNFLTEDETNLIYFLEINLTTLGKLDCGKYSHVSAKKQHWCCYCHSCSWILQNLNL